MGITGGPTLEELAQGVPGLIASWRGWSQSEEAGSAGPAERSQTDILIGYTEDSGLFHAPDQKAYATFGVGDHLETWPIESRHYELYLRRRYYEDQGRAPKVQALNDAVATIAAKAMFGGPEAQVNVRLAGYGNAVYVDLCNEAWEAMEITPEGRRVVSDPPVKFVRSNNSALLPYPVPGGDVDELREFLNLDEHYFKLVVGWLVGALNPDGPYPVLEIVGWQGTSKSTASRLLVALTDPAVAPLRALPANERDLAIAADGRRVLAYDNVSYIKPDTSDAMCRLSTGGGFGTRKLYSDAEEMIFDAKRPQIVNGINPVVLRGDLQERSLQVQLNPIPPEERRQEREFWGEFEEAWPRIFGALLDAVGCALRNLDAVRLEESPRMADFAAWATAAEEALGWEPGEFVEAYAGNRKQASEALLENDLVAAAVDSLLKTRPDGEYSGTAEDLLATLNHGATDDIKRSRSWPKAPNLLSRRLNLIAPALKEAGIDYRQHEEGRERRRIKTLRRIGPAPGKNDRRGATASGGETAGQDPDDAGDEGEPSDDADFVFEDPDYLRGLTELGWRRDARPPIGSTDDTLAVGAGPGEDPVARFLRHNVPVYRGPHSRLWHVPIAAPLSLNAEDMMAREAEGGGRSRAHDAAGDGPPPRAGDLSPPGEALRLPRSRLSAPVLQAEPGRARRSREALQSGPAVCRALAA